MTVPGNHEVKNRNGTHYKERFKMPKNTANEGNSEFYSLELGLAYYIMIKSEAYLTGTKE
jgi:hypothetical protein